LPFEAAQGNLSEIEGCGDRSPAL